MNMDVQYLKTLLLHLESIPHNENDWPCGNPVFMFSLDIHIVLSELNHFKSHQ